MAEIVSMGRGALFYVDWLIGQGQTNMFHFKWSPVTAEWQLWHDSGEEGPEPEKYAPVNLTGWSARCQAKVRPGDNIPWFTLTDEISEDGWIELGEDGAILGVLNAEASERWGTQYKRPGTVDLELVDPEGVVVTFFRGTIRPELETTTVEHPDE